MLKKACLVGVSVPVAYLSIAILLIFSQFPAPLPAGRGLDFSSAATADDNPNMPLQALTLSDGTSLGYRQFTSSRDSAPLLILIHGSGWHGGGYQSLAHRLAMSDTANVIVPDLRGHGPNPNRRGDVEYIGQLEDDIAELISETRQPSQKVVVAGHSSGGGLVIRMSGGPHRDLIDAAVLLAPFLKFDAPTVRPNSGGWAHPLIRRTIGLIMLNQVGITAFNGMTSIQFRFPEEVLNGAQGFSATAAYSYRLNTSFAPRFAYEEDIANLPPFLVLVGDQDEAFVPEAFEPTMRAFTSNGQYSILKGTDHLGIIHSEETSDLITAFLESDK
jgi:pimeloyl-ACP methyl ester carboxylesterase